MLAGARRRAIALVERESDDEPSMLTMRELAVATDADGGPRVTRHRRRRNHRYRVVAAHFEDMTTFFPMLGEYEVWQLINLTGDTHPIHLHLDPFQILARHPIRYEIPEDGIEDRDLAATITLERDPDDELDHAIDDNERGLKDTIRVNPNEIVEIAVRFTTYSGRYMYHCHILEHEDRDMMRPFVTMASELMPFTGLRSAHDTSESTSPSRARRARALSSYSRLLDEAVRVARRIPALQAGLVHAQTAEVVAVREEARVDGHAAGLCVRVDAGHPSAHAVRVEDVVPPRVERVGEVHAPAVAADLHHLRSARQRQLGMRRGAECGRRCRPGAPSPPPRVVRVADVVLLQLARPPARHVQPAVVDGQVDVAHQRRDRAEGLKRRWAAATRRRARRGW